jgi:hypothetical protein
VDNTAANSGTFPDWTASNRGVILEAGEPVLRFSDQTLALGPMTFGLGTPGYASMALGYYSLARNTTGRRNTAGGVYSLERCTTGYENATWGTHAGGGLTTAAGCSLMGFAAGGADDDMGNFVTGMGAYVLSSSQKKGSNIVAVGAYSLSSYTGGEWSNILALGYMSGKYCNASNQFFLDSRDRTNIAGCQDAGLMYGEFNATASAQRLRLNAFTRIGPPNTAGASASTVANLPAAAAALTGYRGYVTDSSVAAAGNYGATVAGGGANCVPVFCTGSAWIIA